MSAQDFGDWKRRAGDRLRLTLTDWPNKHFPRWRRDPGKLRGLVVTVTDARTGEVVTQRATWRPLADIQHEAGQPSRLDCELAEWCLTDAMLEAAHDIGAILFTDNNTTVVTASVKALVKRQALARGKSKKYAPLFDEWQRAGFTEDSLTAILTRCADATDRRATRRALRDGRRRMTKRV